MKHEWILKIKYKTNGVDLEFISYQPTLGRCFDIIEDIICDEILKIYITKIKI